MQQKVKRTVRVQNLIKDFMTLWNDGHSIAEIAKRYQVSQTHLYKNLLEEIAQSNGFLSREDLLSRHLSKREGTISKQEIVREKANIDEIDELFKEIDENLSNIIKNIDERIIKEEH